MEVLSVIVGNDLSVRVREPNLIELSQKEEFKWFINDVLNWVCPFPPPAFIASQPVIGVKV